MIGKTLVAAVAGLALAIPASAASLLEQISPTPTAYVLATDYNTASFGATVADITASLFRLSGSGVDGLSLGCSAGDFGAGVSGTIVLLARGTCEYNVKAKYAQDAGALAILVVNNQMTVGAPGLGGTNADVTIAAFGLSSDLGALLADQTLTDPTVIRLALGDDISTSDAPEPATWMMMLAGFGLVGSGLRRGRKDQLARA